MKTGISGFSKGFTLVELLVVLAIAAAIGGLVGPDIWRSYQKAGERLTVIQYGEEITALRLGLMNSGHGLTIAENGLVAGEGQGQAGLPLPGAGWTVSANSGILLLPTGVTNGGDIHLDSPTGRNWLLKLAALDGKVTVSLQ